MFLRSLCSQLAPFLPYARTGEWREAVHPSWFCSTAGRSSSYDAPQNGGKWDRFKRNWEAMGERRRERWGPRRGMRHCHLDEMFEIRRERTSHDERQRRTRRHSVAESGLCWLPPKRLWLCRCWASPSALSSLLPSLRLKVHTVPVSSLCASYT